MISHEDFDGVYRKNESIASRFVNYLLEFLEEKRFKVYIAERDACLGRSVFDELQHAYEQSRRCLVVLTPDDPPEDGWTRYRQQFTFLQHIRDRSSSEYMVIGVDVTEKDIPGFLTVQAPLIFPREFDVRNRANETQWSRLTRVILSDTVIMPLICLDLFKSHDGLSPLLLSHMLITNRRLISHYILNRPFSICNMSIVIDI